MDPRFAYVRDWIFDLDNCLYPASTGLFSLIDERMGAYIARLLGVDVDDMLVQRYGRHHRLWRDEIIQGCSTLGQIPVCAKLTA